jgi:hypothetical protein
MATEIAGDGSMTFIFDHVTAKYDGAVSADELPAAADDRAAGKIHDFPGLMREGATRMTRQRLRARAAITGLSHSISDLQMPQRRMPPAVSGPCRRRAFLRDLIAAIIITATTTSTRPPAIVY